MIAQPENMILAALPAEDLQFLGARSRLEDLVYDVEVIRPYDAVQRVLFPEAGVISIITEGPDGEAVEAGIVGCEGAAGLFEALGSGAYSSRGTVQKSGAAWSVPAADCRHLFEHSRPFRHACACASEFGAVEAKISMLCRSHHPVAQRMARWLLEMADRSATASDLTLTLTQEHLALMLGVQRTTVTQAAHELRSVGAISYSRGRINIVDAEVLEQRACGCRAMLAEHRSRIIGAMGEPRV